MIDFSKDEEYAALPEGAYQATIFESKIEPPNAKGNSCINVHFRISEGSYENRRIFERFWLTAKSVWRLKKLLVSVGALDSGFSGSFDETTIPGKIAGEALTIYLGQETYQDNTKNVVNSVSPAAVSAPDLPF